MNIEPCKIIITVSPLEGSFDVKISTENIPGVSAVNQQSPLHMQFASIAHSAVEVALEELANDARSFGVNVRENTSQSE